MDVGVNKKRGRPRKPNPIGDLLDEIRRDPRNLMAAAELAEFGARVRAVGQIEDDLIGPWRGRGPTRKLALKYALVGEFPPEDQARITEEYKKKCECVTNGARKTAEDAAKKFDDILTQYPDIQEKVLRGQVRPNRAARILATRCGNKSSSRNLRRQLEKLVAHHNVGQGRS